jgi:Helix-turn-helix
MEHSYRQPSRRRLPGAIAASRPRLASSQPTPNAPEAIRAPRPRPRPRQSAEPSASRSSSCSRRCRVLAETRRAPLWDKRSAAPARRRTPPSRCARRLPLGGGTVQATDAERLTAASKHLHAHSWPSTFELMRDDPRSIGDRIRERRRALGLSQRDLSQPGISYAYISRIESGQRRPSLKALRKTGAEARDNGALARDRRARPRCRARRARPRVRAPTASSSSDATGTQSARRKRARVARKSPPRNIFCPRRRQPAWMPLRL